MGNISTANKTTKDGRHIIIRSTQESDAEGVLNLSRAITLENIHSLTQADELPLTIEEKKKWLKSHIENPNHLIVIAELDNQIIGILDFSNGPKKRIAHTGEFGMGIAKDFRRQGIGSLLLCEFIEWAKANPVIEKVNLCVHQTNSNAIAMHEKHGFIQEGVRSKHLKYSDTEYVDTVLMRLQL